MRRGILAWLKLILFLSDEAAVIFIVVFLLWKLGVSFPAWSLAAIGGVSLAIIFLLHWILWPVLTDRRMGNPAGVVGLEGKVVVPLAPEGVVKVRGELWKARSTGAEVDVDQRVRVVGLEGLKLMVEVSSGGGEVGDLSW